MTLYILLYSLPDDTEYTEVFQTRAGAEEFLGRKVLELYRKNPEVHENTEEILAWEECKNWTALADWWFGPKREWTGESFYAIDEKELRP